MITPIEVVAHLCEPIVTYGGVADPMCIDGPLAWAKMTETPGVPPLPQDWPMDFDLPLARERFPDVGGEGLHPGLLDDGAPWVWCAGPARYEPLLHSRMEVRRRPSVHEMIGWTGEKSVQTAMGRFKGGDLSYPTVYTQEVRWWAVGVPDEVLRLLTRCNSIGKLRHHGNGAVDRWEVFHRGEPESWRVGKALPMAGGAPSAIRPPYWHPSRRCPCSVGTP